jgi:Domain of unknown function (DUF4160)
MPTIAYFYGIMIQMYYDDHQPPHFHARYGDAKAIVRLSDGDHRRRTASHRHADGPAVGSGAKRRIAG